MSILRLGSVDKHSEKEHRAACRNQVSDTDNTHYSNIILVLLVTSELTEHHQIFVQSAKKIEPKCTPELTNLERAVDRGLSFGYFNWELAPWPLGIGETEVLTKAYFNRLTNNFGVNV
jgi:hypothetical protein